MAGDTGHKRVKKTASTSTTKSKAKTKKVKK